MSINTVSKNYIEKNIRKSGKCYCGITTIKNQTAKFFSPRTETYYRSLQTLSISLPHSAGWVPFLRWQVHTTAGLVLWPGLLGSEATLGSSLCISTSTSSTSCTAGTSSGLGLGSLPSLGPTSALDGVRRLLAVAVVAWGWGFFDWAAPWSMYVLGRYFLVGG